MKKYEKEILQAQLDNEKKVLNDLKESYDDALAQINGKIAQLLGRQDADLPHVIYQVEYQRMLKTQVQAILEQLQMNEFQTVSEYLTASYNEGFIASQYAMQSQGVPLIFPIDQKQVVQAIQHETKLSSPLYDELGHDIKELSKTIAGEISRGISAGQGYGEIARNLASYANIPLNNAMRIARTESHRIQCKSAYDAQTQAKAKGADVVKEWNSYLDGKTRPHHRRLNGQIREIEEPFEVAGFKPMFPGDFGDPAEDCNCRCALLQRARWELDDEETQYLGDTSSMTEEQREEIAAKLGIPVDELDNYSESIVPLNATSLDDFRDKYNNIWHYEGSEEQRINLAIAEETRQGILSQRVRSNVQKMNNDVLENNGNSDIIRVSRGQLDTGYNGRIPDDKLEEYNKRAFEQIKLDTGYSDEQATEFHNALLEYFGGDYETIETSPSSDKTNTIIEGLSRMPTYDGSISRGLCFYNEPQEASKFAQLKVGDTLPQKGVIESWSSDNRAAMAYATPWSQGDSVILECAENISGVGVQHISKFGSVEAEVTVVNPAYEVADIVIMNKYQYLSEHLEELESDPRFYAECYLESESEDNGDVVIWVKVQEK